ncbi:MAG TPA: peptidoglycan editing factor PgeF [Vicinamibacterales bacterium]
MLRDDAREWAEVAASLGLSARRLLLITQVHGSTVAIARRGSVADWKRPEADAIVTDDPDVGIGVRTADCTPVLIHDPSRHVCGAAHAGWRGTAANVVGATVEALHREFGSDPRHLVAAIGPCLGACCGEVGPDVVAAFRSGGAEDATLDAWFTAGEGDRSFLDLERANRDQLARAGVPAEAIFASGLCTKTHHARLHSYRAARETAGRMLAAIRIAAP